ncbi:MAG: hypothetical protein AMR96_06970 [Candidatus Adiutrix intracellularis]|nr:MAG: hypothetical protein AMR96_06970 [Candidatus Adiutrix intracellularis]
MLQSLTALNQLGLYNVIIPGQKRIKTNLRTPVIAKNENITVLLTGYEGVKTERMPPSRQAGLTVRVTPTMTVLQISLRIITGDLKSNNGSSTEVIDINEIIIFDLFD